MAFDLIYLPLYLHIFRYFSRFSITDFSKTSAQVMATLVMSHMLGHMVGISQGHVLKDFLWLLVVDQALMWAQKGIG